LIGIKKIFKPNFEMYTTIKKIFIFPIKLYQIFLSPMLGASKCRFTPTCSHYMVQSIEEWGVLKGIWMGLNRIRKCHPWGGHGYDPVPLKNKQDEKK
jgi:uncharacterized protein